MGRDTAREQRPSPYGDEQVLLRPQLLSAFVEADGRTKAEIATAIGVQPSALSNWLSGRAVRREGARRSAHDLDEAVHADGLLLALWQAAAAPAIWPARYDWRYNFASGGGPVWLWIRMAPQESAVDDGADVAHLRWGEPLQGDLSLAPGGAGALVQFPLSVPNPPIEVRLSRAGWVECGRGEIPERVAAAVGAVLVDGVGLHAAHEPAARSSASWLLNFGPAAVPLREVRSVAAELKVSWHLVVDHLVALRPGMLPHSLDSAETAMLTYPGDASVDDHGEVDAQFHLSPTGFRELRLTRGYTVQSLAEGVTRMRPHAPVSVKQVRRLEEPREEEGVWIRPLPAVEDLVSRLDTLLGANGHLGIDRTARKARPRTPGESVPLVFPRWWLGPVWLRFTGPGPGSVGVATLRWGHWQRRQTVRSGDVLSTNKALAVQDPLRQEAEDPSPPLLVLLPPGWRVSAGTGAVPWAQDVNHGWSAASAKAALQLLLGGLATVREARAIRNERARRTQTERRPPS